jgi:hypothetical protein
MSFFTNPVSSARPASPVSQTPRAARPSAAKPTPDAVRVETMSATPPDEVLDAIGVAARAADSLEQSGRRMQFSVDPPSGRVTAQVTDLSGAVLGSLTGAQVLAVAGGEPLA